MDLKTLDTADLEVALVTAQKSWSELRAEDTESICLDILSVEPQNAEALELLLRSRIELLKKVGQAVQPDEAIVRIHYQGIDSLEAAESRLKKAIKLSSSVVTSFKSTFSS